MHRKPLVEIEAAHAVQLGDVDELVVGLLLVDEPRLGSHRPGRNRQQRRDRGCDDEPAAPEERGARKRDDHGRHEQRALGADRRNEDERREERAQEAADRRERVQPARYRSRFAHVVDREPHRERRDHPQQRHRRREEGEHREERSDRRSRGDLIEPLDRHVEEGPGREGHDRDQHRSGEDDAAEQAGLGRRSASRPPSQYPKESEASTSPITFAQTIVELP